MKRPILGLTAIAWLLCTLPGNAAGTAIQKSVLLIYDARSDMLGNIAVDQAIRNVLNEAFTVNLDIRSEYFEPSASPEKDFPFLLSWLRNKYSDRTFDVVIPVGAIALQFVQDYRGELFPRSQIAFFGRTTALDLWDPAVPITGVVAPRMDAQVEGTLEVIRSLQPDLERLVVVTGRSTVDREWEQVAYRNLRSLEGNVAVTYLAGASFESVLNRVANLPRKTAVLFLSFNEDGAGRRLLRTQILNQVVQTATAPVYSNSAIYLETGIVGGALVDQQRMAVEAGGLIKRLLQGEDIRHMPVREAALVPMANGSAMDRWRLREDRLPPGTTIRFRNPSLWDTYRWHIAGVLLLCLLEAVLIFALLVHRAHRRRAEKSVMESKQLLQSTIDALSTRVALLDENGTIIAANRPWKAFVEANHGTVSDGASYNYLEMCASAAQGEEGSLVSSGIRGLMSGEREDFRCVYSSPQANGISWFQVRISRFDMEGTPRLVVTHEDVTELKQAHDTQQQLSGQLMRAQDDERRRIARDLHDATVQNIVAIKANLTCMEKPARTLDPSAFVMLQESMSLCDQVIQELRTLSYVLHPPFLDEAGLIPALQWFVRGFIQRSGVHVELMIQNDIGRLHTEVETALFRVVQESLTNIHRHSGSRSAVIWVTIEQDSVVLRVRDEGQGFTLQATDNGNVARLPGVGILGMRQRLRQFGGQLDIESSPQGTIVNASIPLSEERNYAHLAR